MSATFVNVYDLKIPVVVVDNGGDIYLSVLYELLLIPGTVDRVLGLSVFDVVLLVVVGQGHSRDLQVAPLIY